MNHWWTLQQLKFKNPELRRQAVDKLVADGSPLALTHLLTATNDADTGVRLAVVKALGRMKDAQVLRPLAEALRDSDATVRETAIAGLMQFADGRCADALVPLLKDRNPAVARRAARGLDLFGWQPKDDDQRVQRFVALGEFLRAAAVGAAAIEPLMALLRNPEFPQRRLVVEALSGIADERVAAPLLGVLKDSDPHVRVAAIEALANVKSSASVEPLLALLRDNDPVVRAAAANTLGKVADAGSIDRLATALKDSHWSVRKCAVDAMARLKDPRAVPPLTTLLHDPDNDVREAVVEALARIRDKSAVEKLVPALADAQSSVRYAAAGALGRIDADWKCSEAAHAAIPALKALQEDKDYWVRHAATDAINKLLNARKAGPEAALSSDALSGKRVATLEALAQAIGDWDRDVRQAAAEALGRLEDPRGMHALNSALQDADDWVRQAVGNAIQSLTARTASPAFAGTAL